MSYGVQASYTSPRGSPATRSPRGVATSPAAARSPRGVATLDVITRSGPLVNGYGGKGGTPPSSSPGGGVSKVDLSSLYEQCKGTLILHVMVPMNVIHFVFVVLQTHSSLVEARTALNQQQTQQ